MYFWTNSLYLKTKILILFFFTLLFSCNKKGNFHSSSHDTDSISVYMKIANNENTSDQNKLFAITRAYRQIQQSTNDTRNRDTLFSIAFKFYNLKDWDMFNKVSNTLLKNSKNANDSINLVKVFRFRGNYLKRIESYDSSYYYYLEAEKIYLKQNDDLNRANILFNKGIVQHSVSDYLGAQLSLTKAYAIFENSDEKDKLYGTLNQLGLVYNELKEYDKAIDFHNKALAIVREYKLQNQEHQEAVCFNNLGYLFVKQKKYDQAINNFELALKDKDIKKDDPLLYSLLIDNLAYSRLRTNNFKALPDLFFNSLKIRDSLQSKPEMILSNVHLSEYYGKIKDTAQSLRYINYALNIAKQNKETPFDHILALKQASLIDKKNSARYSDDYFRLSDSLQVEERRNIDRFARIQFETSELLKENDSLEEKNRNILNYFMGAIIIGGVLFFMRIQRSRSRELALTQSQQQANEEIYRLIISHQNQIEEGRDLEKRHISKELHDGVLGRLFGLRLNLDGLNNFDDEDAKQQRLEYLNELQLIEQDLREISHELNRENLVLINNFVAIINNLLEQQGKINPAKVKSIIDVDIDWDMMPNTAKINLYRILQEALQNINKYADAKNILVHFRKDKKGNLLFNIEDDGVGYDVNSKKSRGIGIKNIVSRTQQCQGIIDIKSEIGKGSKIIITFPLENKTIKL